MEAPIERISGVIEKWENHTEELVRKESDD